MEKLSSKQQKEKYRLANNQYFEGIVQLREINNDILHEVIDHIEDNDVRIAKHIKQKNGVDLYLSSQKFIQKLERWLKDHHKCQTSMTRTLHTRDTKANKDLYRLTLLVTFLTVSVGDVVEYNGEEVKITTLGKKPSGKVLATGKRIFLDIKLLK